MASLVAALGAPGACHRAPKGEPELAALPALPVPAPDGLLAEGEIVAPDATWQRLQRGVGGAAGLFPSAFASMLCSVAAVDPRIALEVDGSAPAYVVVAGDVAAPGWVVVARLVDERRARILVAGDAGRFEARDAGDGVLELAPRSGRDGGPVAAIARGGWFVLARSAADLSTLVPYATRTLASRPPPSAPKDAWFDVPEAALSGPIAAAFSGSWAKGRDQMLADDRALREKHGGRSPDFGDPRAIVGAIGGWVDGKVGVLRDLRGAHFAVDVGDLDVHVAMTAAPSSTSGPASALVSTLHAADPAPLLAMPRDAAVAVLVRSDAASREADAPGIEGALFDTLGPRLTPADQKRLHGVFDGWTHGRGDWAALAVVAAPKGLGLVADVAAVDPRQVSRSIHEALEAATQVPALRDPLEHGVHVRAIRFGAQRGAAVETATFVGDAARPYSLAWSAGEADVKVAIGEDPVAQLAPTSPGLALRDDPEIRALFERLGAVADVVVGQPGRAPGCAGLAGGIALGLTPRAGAAGPAIGLDFVASDLALRCLAKSSF